MSTDKPRIGLATPLEVDAEARSLMDKLTRSAREQCAQREREIDHAVAVGLTRYWLRHGRYPAYVFVVRRFQLGPMPLDPTLIHDPVLQRIDVLLASTGDIADLDVQLGPSDRVERLDTFTLNMGPVAVA